MTPVSPRISVVMPVFNAEHYVGAAIRSVLTQTISHTTALELLIVDDGSTDGSMAVARQATDARCRILQQAHSGAATARNLGISSARGEFLAFLDADDVWRPETLARQWLALAGDAAVDMVFGHCITIDPNGMALEGHEARPAYSLCSMLIRRASFDRVGPLSTQWRVGEFIDWYARAEDAGLRHVMLPELLLQRRAHAANTTAGHGDARIDYARVVAAAAARRSRLGRRRE